MGFDVAGPDLVYRHPIGTIVTVAIPAGGPSPEELSRLHPEERARTGDMGPFRLSTWAAGRRAMAEALRAIGGPRAPILSTDRDGPAMPAGFVGSISHKRDLAVALAARDEGWHVGVDVETPGPSRLRIVDRVLTPDERDELMRRPEHERWPALLARFSLKESVYKALDPFVRRYVGFHEARVHIPDAAPGMFADATVQLDLTQGEGPFEVQASLRCGLRQGVLTVARIRPARPTGA